MVEKETVLKKQSNFNPPYKTAHNKKKKLGFLQGNAIRVFRKMAIGLRVVHLAV